MVVAGNAGVLPEIVIDGNTVLLFEANSELAIKDALKRLIKFPLKRISQMADIFLSSRYSGIVCKKEGFKNFFAFQLEVL